MDLTTWLPGLFLFGLLIFGVCFTFIDGCEKI